MTGNSQQKAGATAALAALAVYLLSSTAVYAAPPIRMSAANRVPACVSPGRLMDFLRERNPDVDPRYEDIARWYKHWGDQYGVRWDYAFFQMVLETNYLKYRRGNGRRGDVHEKQNNFAGLGATGGGVAGERFRDVKTGVQAQVEHLVAYSGDRVESPIAKRTRENQDDIIAKSRRLGREVTFGDLARRWAADRQYAKSIDIVANLFRTGHCKGPVVAGAVPEPKPAIRLARNDLVPSRLGGPKPQRLAGPETMPWDGEPQPKSAQRAPEPEAKTNAAKPKPAAPVKTLWSRNAPAIKNPDPVVPAADTKPIIIEPDPTLPPNASTLDPAASSSAAQAAAGAQPAMSQKGEEPENLPEFRIAPRMPAPSHLGGPLPPMENDASEQAAAGTLESGACRVLMASYGGRKTLLVRAANNSEVQYTALTVLDGFEKAMFETYAKAGRPGLELVGSYSDKDAALAEGRRLCPEPKT